MSGGVWLTVTANRSQNHSGDRYSQNCDQSNLRFWSCDLVTSRREERTFGLCLHRAGLSRWGTVRVAGMRSEARRTGEYSLPEFCWWRDIVTHTSYIPVCGPFQMNICDIHVHVLGECRAFLANGLSTPSTVHTIMFYVTSNLKIASLPQLGGLNPLTNGTNFMCTSRDLETP